MASSHAIAADFSSVTNGGGRSLGEFARGPIGFAALLAGASALAFAANGRIDTAAAAAALAGAAAAWVFVRGLTRRDPSLQWDNESLPDRVRNLVTLLRLARRSIVILTGCAHHRLFDKDEVIEALRALPQRVKIIVCHENAPDPESERFWTLLRARPNTRIIQLPPETRRMQHGMAVDDLHCKLEALAVPDAEDLKHVDYFAFDRPRARAYRRDVERLIESARLQAPTR